MVIAGRETYGFPYDPFPYVSLLVLSIRFVGIKLIILCIYLVNKYIKIK
jgi:hypothetical protein